MTSEITIDAQPVGTIVVNLVGVKYNVKPPKTAIAMKFAVQAKVFKDEPEKIMEVMTEWMDKAFGKAISKKVQKRLENEADDLDIPHVMALMEKIIEVQTEGDPTS